MASSSPADPSLETEAPHAAVTREWMLNPDLQEQLPKPFLPFCGMSVLQQHVAFFDRNGDGLVYPWETFKGLRAVGCSYPVSFIFGFLINLVMSYPTQPRWLPSPLLSIHIKNIHKGKHGSDSETYDTEGSRTGSPPLVSGCYSTAWQRIKTACCNGKLSGAPSMAVYLSDCNTIRNPPECAEECFVQLEKGLTLDDTKLALHH